MANSLSNFVNNLAERIHKIKLKYGNSNKKCETCGIKFEDCECCFEYTSVNDDSLQYKCLCCNKNYQKDLMKTQRSDLSIDTNFLTIF